MNTKKLKIEVQHDFNHLLSYAFPLCIVLSEPKLQGWYMESYVNHFFSIDDMKQSDGGIIDALDYGEFTRMNSGIIDYSFVGCDILKHIPNISEVLTDYINKECYCVVFLDEFDILGSDNYNKIHFSHEFLIYGYSEENMEFDAIFFKENLFSTISISKDIVNQSFVRNLKLIHSRAGSWSEKTLMTFKLRDKLTNFDFNLDNFRDKLISYVDGKRDEMMMYYRGWSHREQDDATFGVETSLGICEYIRRISEKQSGNRNELYVDFIEMYKTAHLLYQHRTGMLKRFEFVATRFDCSADYKKSVLEYKRIVGLTQIIRMKLLKEETLFKRQNKVDWTKTNPVLNAVQVSLKSMYHEEKAIVKNLIPLLPL